MCRIAESLKVSISELGWQFCRKFPSRHCRSIRPFTSDTAMGVNLLLAWHSLALSSYSITGLAESDTQPQLCATVAPPKRCDVAS